MSESILSTLKGRLLPPSSRSFHELFAFVMGMAGEQDRRLSDIAARQLAFQDEIAERLDRLEDAARKSEVRDVQSRIYLEAIHRRDGESPDDARRRMFASIPPATGVMRLWQDASAKLMAELDRLCSELGVEYWFAYGTLVAALSRGGFIPWDDDIDICMMREDIERLRTHLEGDPDYQVSVVYDRFVLCKQVRFSAKDPLVPCFIDLSIWDYATDAAQERDDALRKMRLDIMSDLAHVEGYDGYWADYPYLFEPGSGNVIQAGYADPADQDPVAAVEIIGCIEGVFTRYRDEALERGIYCAAGEAGALAYAFDNVYDAPWRRILWERDMLLPPRRHAFEGYEFCVPNRAEDVAEECYPGYPFLPNDLFSHAHFQREFLGDQAVQEALRGFIAR